MIENLLNAYIYSLLLEIGINEGRCRTLYYFSNLHFWVTLKKLDVCWRPFRCYGVLKKDKTWITMKAICTQWWIGFGQGCILGHVTPHQCFHILYRYCTMHVSSMYCIFMILLLRRIGIWRSTEYTEQKRFIYRLLTRHGCLPVFAGRSLIFQWKWTRADLKLAVQMREF